MQNKNFYLILTFLTKWSKCIKMVSVTHSGENREKLDLILGAAQERFGHYGLEKTTMREIAGDVGMSKASLYYYFPDKNSLFYAVIRKEQDEFFSRLDETVSRPEDPDEMLRGYIRVRNLYFKKFINLSKLRLSGIREIRPVIRDLIEELKEKETDYIRRIIVMGLDRSAYRSLDENEVASIFLNTLHAIRRSYFSSREVAAIDSRDLEVMEGKMMVFLDLFLHGLRRTGQRRSLDKS